MSQLLGSGHPHDARPHGAGPAPVSGGAFVEHGPDPSLVADCVHCGFCLPSCPTYLLWGEEMDSPRGRIYLMREGITGSPMSPSMVQHFDACLSCMACVTACPSGVHYGQLIEETRAEIERQHRRPFRERLLRGAIFALFPYRRRLAPLAGLLRNRRLDQLRARFAKSPLARRLPAPLPTMLEIAPSVAPAETVPERSSALGERRGTVALLRGCVQDAFFPNVNAATVRVLNAEGFDVFAPSSAGCCGALSSHSGRRDEAQHFARELIDALGAAGVDAVVVNAAGCGSLLKEYAELLADDPAYRSLAAEFADKVRDISEILDEVPPRAERHPIELRIAYHDACHLAHAQQVRAEPRRLLDQIPGITRAEIGDGELCCGSAGIYNLLQPEPARALGDRKATRVAALDVELLVSANPGCTMQIGAALRRQGHELPARHTIELLDASIRGLNARELLR